MAEILPSLFGRSQTLFATFKANATIYFDGTPDNENITGPGIVINIL
jgi:hypothetical protein